MTVLTKSMFEEMREELCGVESEFVELKNGIGVNVIQLTAEGAVAMSNAQSDGKTALFDWVVACCVDDAFNPIFSKEDVMKMPHEMASKLTNAVVRVNGLLNTETSEEAEKNSEVADS